MQLLYQLVICDTELTWFWNYSTNQMQRVKVNSKYSEWKNVLGGIPQGSALGPLLFLIYVNEMPLQIKSGVLVQYVNVICLICRDGYAKR